MNNKALLQLGSELLFHLRHTSYPADRAIGEYVSVRKFLGSKDKHFLSEVYYHTLRNLRRIDEALVSSFGTFPAFEERLSSGFPVSKEEGARAWLRKAEVGRIWEPGKMDRCVDTARLGLAAIELKLDNAATVAEELSRCWPVPAGRSPMRPESIQRMVENAAQVMELYGRPGKPIEEARRFSFPDWLWSQMCVGRNPEEMPVMGAALCKQASPSMRVNTLKCTIEEAHAALKAASIDFVPGAHCDTAVILSKRLPRHSFTHFNLGWFEMQDEGSQMVGTYAAPKPGDVVIDACAGGGGKSLHAAALMQNKGRIYAFDIDPDRLFPLGKRTARCGVSIVDATERLGPGGAPPDSLPLADLVLVDAPCSGTGTIRRNPEARWRLSPAYLGELGVKQRSILNAWAPRTRPGGRLVYATCSLLRDENEEVVKDFLNEHPEYARDGADLKLAPHTHGGDGFYAARLVRKA